jgi:hypothetical protein
MDKKFGSKRILVFLFIVAVLDAACTPAQVRKEKVETFVFNVAVNANVLDIKKKDPQQKGVFDGGYANIKVRDKDKLTLQWNCPNETIEIWVHSWENDEGKKPGRLSKKYYEENLPEPEYFKNQNSVDFQIASSNGHKGTEAYKYDIKCGDARYDPVIIINR